MDLKEKLELLRLTNKFKSFNGIKAFKINSMDELTEREKEVLDSIETDNDISTDKLALGTNYSNYLLWSKERITPYAGCNSEIIIVYDYKLVFVLIENIDALLESYFKEEECFSIYILNRKLKKWIVISEGEYFLEYFNRDI